LDIKNRDGFTEDYRQIELYGAIDLLLLAPGDISADGFGYTFNGLGGDLQASEQFHLLATVIERAVLSHQRLHAPHAGREIGVLDIQFLVGGELALVAIWTQIPGPPDFHRAQSGQQAARAQFAVTRLATAGTRKAALLFGWFAKVQQPGEGGGTGVMQSGAESHLHRFQICLSGLLALGEDASQ
jgi:hypothetical protein